MPYLAAAEREVVIAIVGIDVGELVRHTQQLIELCIIFVEVRDMSSLALRRERHGRGRHLRCWLSMVKVTPVVNSCLAMMEQGELCDD